MKRFDYIRPTSLTEAIAALSEPDTHILAGGTNMLDLMKGSVIRPLRLVDITRIPGLDRIEFLADGACRIGCLAGNADLANQPEFAQRFPAVAEALLSGASPQIRNMATVAGNLLQRTRCSYFHDLASACNQRAPGSGCDARSGETAMHAVLGWSPDCIATHPSDFCVPLCALDARVEIEGRDGRRDVAITAFFAPPGRGNPGISDLKPGEIIVAIRLPAAAVEFAAHACYLKVRDRTSFAFALVSAAVGLKLDKGRVTEARIALGGVAYKPWRLHDAEAALKGAPADRDSFATAAGLALRYAQPSGDNAYKIELARRVIIEALGRAAVGTADRVPALPASPFSHSATESADATR